MPSPVGVPEAGSLSSCPPPPLPPDSPQGPNNHSHSRVSPWPSHWHGRGQVETGLTPLNPSPWSPPEPSLKPQDILVPFSSPYSINWKGLPVKGHLLHSSDILSNVCLTSAPAQRPRNLRPLLAPQPGLSRLGQPLPAASGSLPLAGAWEIRRQGGRQFGQLVGRPGGSGGDRTQVLAPTPSPGGELVCRARLGVELVTQAGADSCTVLSNQPSLPLPEVES